MGFNSDPDISVIREECSKLVGREFIFSIAFGEETISLDECDGLNNAVGYIMEQIIYVYLKKSLPTFSRGPKQQSPDYYNRSIFEYEMKCFQYQPSFDISSFNVYIEQLSQPNGVIRKLVNTKYILFKYNIENGRIRIEKFWLLSIFDIVNYVGKYPISIQVKRGFWYNIRPSSCAKWIESSDREMKMHLFLERILECIRMCPNSVNKKKTHLFN